MTCDTAVGDDRAVVWRMDMDAMEALTGRRSVRRYGAGPVDPQTIERVVDAGRWAATALNEQPWEFVVVTDAGTRARIASLTDHGKFIADAPVCIAVFCRDTKYYLEDGAAATQNMLVAACAQGLGTCWVAGDKKPYGGAMAELLGVPDGHKLVSLVAMGHSDDTAPRAKKRPLGDVLHRERFGNR